EDGIRDLIVTGVQTCALPICTSAKIAVVTSRTRSAADASPSGFRLMTAQSASPRLGVAVGWRSKGATRAVTVDTEDSPSLIMDPRIQPRVRQVDEQVQRDERGRHQHDVGLHD